MMGMGTNCKSKIKAYEESTNFRGMSNTGESAQVCTTFVFSETVGN